MLRHIILLSLLLLLPVVAHAEEGSLKMAVPSKPLDEPNMDNTAFEAWLDNLLCKSLTLGDENYKDVMKEVSPHFTKDGWKGYTSALLKSRILDTISSKHQTATPTPCPSSGLAQRGAYDGRYVWKYTSSIMFDFSGGTEETPTEEYDLKLTVVRTPESENPDGVAIDKWEWRKVEDEEYKGKTTHEPIGD